MGWWRKAAIGLALLLLPGCSNGHSAITIGSPPVTVQPTVPARSISSFCRLAYSVGSQTFPDTAHGYSSAVAADHGNSPDSAAHVVITNTGSRGVTLNSYTLQMFDAGSVIVRHKLSAGPTFLSPGEAYQTWIDLSELSNPVYVSQADFQSATCSVTRWH